MIVGGTYICVCEELCTMDLPLRKVLLFLAIETCDNMQWMY